MIRLPSGVFVPDHIAENVAQSWQRPTCLDLFCGCGGFSLGMIRAGFRVVAGMDHDVASAVTYMHNLGAYPCQFHYGEESDMGRLEKFLSKHMTEKNGIATLGFRAGGGYLAHSSWHEREDDEDGPLHDRRGPEDGVSHFFLGDIRKFSSRQILDAIGMEVGELDCIVGGPPCQGFSRANKNRNVMDPRNSLVFEFGRMICEIQPKTMVMENVPDIVNMVTPEGIPVLDKLARILGDGGFAGIEAFEQALKQQTGCVGLVRRGKGGKKSKEKTVAEPERMQGGLFA